MVPIPVRANRCRAPGGQLMEVRRLPVAFDVPQHRLGAADIVAVLADVGRTLWMSDSECLRQLALERQQIADAENLVDDAGAVPENHRPAGDFLQILPQVAVR